GHRDHAERRQPGVRGDRAQPRLDGRPGDGVLRHDGGGGRGRRGPGDHPGGLPEPRDHQRGRADEPSMVSETTALRWTIALPAAGVLFHLFLGARWPRAVKVVGPGVVAAAFAVVVTSALQLFRLPPGAALHDRVYTWIVAGPFQADAALRLDALSAVMALVVTGVGFLIHVYSVGYMHGDPGLARFFAYLNLFMTAMLILVLADNLLLLFVGWEGVGLCSYLLIGFWYDKVENADAGKKA